MQSAGGNRADSICCIATDVIERAGKGKSPIQLEDSKLPTPDKIAFFAIHLRIDQST